MSRESYALLILDLMGTFAFALNGALTAVRAARLDIVGVITLGMITAIGGGIIRDVLLNRLPPATFQDWRYLAVAAAGALIAFAFAHLLRRLSLSIMILDAVGLSVFAITGATKALDFNIGPAQAIILGTISAVGGGTIRDAFLGRVPTVMRDDLYAVPALVGATIAVVASLLGFYGPVTAIGAATACFLLRVAGVHFNLRAPRPPGTRDRAAPPGQD
ncbi:trimeric intracellular cation channel family protein [Pyxidicoccus parkwayensis]|uniref:Trimeric intracellular cation channel family protein n=1 Tax=Pyxidicoccus parkwayensis TaxID=2813578 RepID=A0ABX7P9J7_9BACT|nr:trimeric intracellular cation channel family protein [Pyxidicoccus parkwaysis]QSQ27138.1 trimeric intracellular cation channel family protein [Pyxidicoccus parkwaysis]